MSDTLSPVTSLNTEQAYRDAVAEATAAAAAYYNTDLVTLDDGAYDALVRGITAAETLHPDWVCGQALSTAVAGGVSTGGDVEHTTAMLSLDNVFSDAELEDWGSSLTRRLGRDPHGFTVEPKLDGLALAARYTGGTLAQLVTRGDGQRGEDVTYAAGSIIGLPPKSPPPRWPHGGGNPTRG
jgi:DNA ligase (NAD+)